jgi:hypothetical protein
MAGDKVGCFQSQVFGIGPQIGYVFPLALDAPHVFQCGVFFRNSQRFEIPQRNQSIESAAERILIRQRSFHDSLAVSFLLARFLLKPEPRSLREIHLATLHDK